MKHKKCTFCLKEAPHSPILEMERHGVEIYFCHECKAEYLYFVGGTLAGTSLYTEINNKTYRWSFNSTGSAQLWFIKEPGEPGVRKNENLVPIKYFSYDEKVPQITPTNINEKL